MRKKLGVIRPGYASRRLGGRERLKEGRDMAVGKKLKAGREKKHLTLEDVSAQTKINRDILFRLEEDRFSEVLNPTYVKGFLRTYARFLQLDEQEILKEYSKFSPPPPDQILEITGETLPSDWRGLIFPAAVFVLVILAAVLTYHLVTPRWPSYGGGTAGREQKKKTSLFRAAKKPEEKATVPSAVALKLEARAKGDCWVRTFTDGKVIFEDVLRAGEKVVWQAEKKFELQVGKAENLTLTLNGKSLILPGEGVIRGIVVTREGLRLSSSH